MARVRANTDFDVEESEDVLAVLKNLSRDMENIEDRQARLQELGIALTIEFTNGEIVVQLADIDDAAAETGRAGNRPESPERGDDGGQ